MELIGFSSIGDYEFEESCQNRLNRTGNQFVFTATRESFLSRFFRLKQFFVTIYHFSVNFVTFCHYWRSFCVFEILFSRGPMTPKYHR